MSPTSCHAGGAQERKRETARRGGRAAERARGRAERGGPEEGQWTLMHAVAAAAFCSFLVRLICVVVFPLVPAEERACFCESTAFVSFGLFLAAYASQQHSPPQGGGRDRVESVLLTMLQVF
mmetsp:Transcript_43557/g.94918  ORF Transcript_43557/g.94918 Transcript_43557/m.94918 type:complete len:122 (-) Transcript_43557:122-487(-)|eukprot:CAMPEP_0204357600 /NCGR_PEP_ID=MMETSP0469-20131031/35862_1 /ASSEMBLY_ACC=CAM_ASM_000384 /TAXON_ID=2969 /ORGANISM="Oxyrrhis marina" /LENGTH=121 /DNA_ID=CAMNT_0051345279 /DNA_START=124 /DNA_END=489 /DNA_ORIENTATION=-